MAWFRRGGFSIFNRGGFALSPPSLPIFVVSVALAVIALLTQYGVLRITILGSGRGFLMLAIAYVVLVAGVVLRRL